MHRVMITFGTLPAMTVALRPGRTTVGSAPSDDIVLSLPEIAQHHLALVSGPHVLRLEADEEDGVQVNGRAVTGVALRAMDVVDFGPYRLRVLDLPDPALDSQDPPTVSDPMIAIGREPARRLLVVSGPEAGRAVYLDDHVTVVGRAPGCALVLTDPHVSWRHLAVERSPEGVHVRDLGSRNGTWLDEQRVDAAPAGAGTRIRAGGTTLLLAGPEHPDVADAGPPREDGLAELVGGSPPMRKLYAAIRSAARSTLPVLLTGETGVGKELAARAVHVLSERGKKPFVPLNCAAIPRDILESELFGHVRGAFTGAVADRKGAFERARGGTLFLDEIGELSPDLQPKLLRVLESGDFTPVGGTAGLRADVRLVSATNQDVEASGQVRRDLFFRIAVLRIELPPLRDHREDIPALVHHVLRTAARDTGLPEEQRVVINPGALRTLAAHDWPGNVRELRNVLHRAVVEAPEGVITRELVLSLLQRTGGPAAGRPRTLEEIEREAIENCLRDCNRSRRAAARRLGIAESTLYEKIRRFGLT